MKGLAETIERLKEIDRGATGGRWTWEDHPATLYAGRRSAVSEKLLEYDPGLDLFEYHHGLNLLGRLEPDSNGANNLDAICGLRNLLPRVIIYLEQFRHDQAERDPLDSKRGQKRLIRGYLQAVADGDAAVVCTRPDKVEPMFRSSCGYINFGVFDDAGQLDYIAWAASGQDCLALQDMQGWECELPYWDDLEEALWKARDEARVSQSETE